MIPRSASARSVSGSCNGEVSLGCFDDEQVEAAERGAIAPCQAMGAEAAHGMIA